MIRPLLGRASPAGARARLSILIFHRVRPCPDSLAPDEPDAHRFDLVCGWLREWFNVLPLDQAVTRLRANELPERALSITFDDGYADNHDLALPILARHGLPATFFIATGFLDGGRMWNDAIVETVRKTRHSSLDVKPLGIGSLGRLDVSDVTARRSAIAALLENLKYLPTERRAEAVRQVSALAQVEVYEQPMMTGNQVRTLRRSGMQIGAHTVHHPILAGLDADAARSEVVQSKKHLEEILDEPVTLFAYPNGKPNHDFTDASVGVVREAGFLAAVTTAEGAAAIDTDPMRLPRFTPWDRSRWRFGARMLRNFSAPPAPLAAAG